MGAAVDPNHPVYNAIPGRYANRIGHGTFTLDGVKYNTPKNDGDNTLHSGPNNWSFRFWNLTDVTSDSITFSIYDPANSTGSEYLRVLLKEKSHDYAKK